VKVTIYTTKTCPYCKLAKAYLEGKGVSYEEKDVLENPDALEEMREKSGQAGVPVLDIDGEVIIGFDKEAIEAALEKAGGEG